MKSQVYDWNPSSLAKESVRLTIALHCLAVGEDVGPWAFIQTHGNIPER